MLFGNEGEFKALFENDDIEKIIKELSALNKTFVITMGAKGAICINKKDIYRTSSKKINKVTDLTGAGDLFASGFIHAFVNKMGLEKALQLGTRSAAEIIKILSSKKPDETRDGVFVLPVEVETLKERLGLYVNNIFKPDTYQEKPLFRGLYFVGDSGIDQFKNFAFDDIAENRNEPAAKTKETDLI